MRLRSIALVFSLLVTACAGSGPIHVQIASYGAQAAKVGLQAQAIVLEADKSGLQPNKDITARSMAAFRDLGVGLQKLADGLVLYDALTPVEQQAQRFDVEKLLQEARRLTRVALLFSGGGENKALAEQLLALFDNLDAVFTEIMRGLRPVAVVGGVQ